MTTDPFTTVAVSPKMHPTPPQERLARYPDTEDQT